MKKWFLTIGIALGCTSALFAQIEERVKAFNAYSSTEYYKAIQQLLKLESQGLGDLESKLLLAEAYYAQRDFQAALEWMQKAVAINDLSPKYSILYAELLKSTSNSAEADKIFQRSGKEYQNKLSSKINAIPDSKYEVLAVPMLNSKGDDFSPAYFRDGIVFVSNAKRKKNLFSWNNRPWLKVYQLPYKPVGTEKGSPSELKMPEINKFHSGPVTFTRQDRLIYFSQNQNLKKKSKSTVSTLGIYSATKQNNKWGNIKPLNINNEAYSISHPALSSDGTEMYFVSDKPGGFGGTDIYYSRLSKGSWSEPVNMGSAINTAENEMFPFLHSDGTLYFASEGHSGYGGLDIFYTKGLNGGWTTPVNMGKPVNSGYDDFALILDKQKLQGYFSSNRPGGAGSDDIYRIVFKDFSPEKQSKLIIGAVSDIVTADLLSGAQVILFYKEQQQVQASTDSNGKYQLDIPEDIENVGLLVAATGYFPQDLKFDVPASGNLEKNVQLQKVEINKSIVVPNIYYEVDKAEITAEAEAELKKLYKLLTDNPSWIIEISAHTDSRADATYNKKLSEKRAGNVVSYLIKNGIASNRLFARGYGESKILNQCVDGVKCTEEEHLINRRTEFKLIGFEQFAENGKDRTSVIFAEEYSAKSDLVYKIQIGVFKEINPKWMQQLSDLGNIEQVPVEGKELLKIFIGPYPTYESAKSFMDKVLQRGLEDAFIIAFHKGKPVTLEEAKKLKK